MRDDVLTRAEPVNLSEWPECTLEAARFDLARSVWCDAVRQANLTDWGRADADRIAQQAARIRARLATEPVDA